MNESTRTTSPKYGFGTSTRDKYNLTAHMSPRKGNTSPR